MYSFDHTRFDIYLTVRKGWQSNTNYKMNCRVFWVLYAQNWTLQQ